MMVHQWVFIKWFKFVDVPWSNFINKCTNLEKKGKHKKNVMVPFGNTKIHHVAL
jgi:hypothetical protein